MSPHLPAVPLEEGMAKNAFDVIVAGLVEAVHVELADEAVHLGVAEVPGQHYLLQLAHILDHELGARWRPVDDLGELVVLGGGRRTLSISKVLAMKPATSAGSSIEREDIYNANNFKAEQLHITPSRPSARTSRGWPGW